MARRTSYGVSVYSRLAVIIVVFVGGGLLCEARPQIAQAEAYPLDPVPRTVPTRGKLTCPDVGLVRFVGDAVPYQSPLTVNPHLTRRLEALEELVVELAIKHYGRAPKRIEHLGSFNCRRIRGWPGYVSEHGLANAVDISGFQFARAKASERDRVPKHLRRAFRVSVLRHWDGRGRNATHACFLRELAREVMARGLFRGVFGPGYPGHKNHFHFDMSPWQMHEVDMGGAPASCRSAD